MDGMPPFLLYGHRAAMMKRTHVSEHGVMEKGAIVRECDSAGMRLYDGMMVRRGDISFG